MMYTVGILTISDKGSRGEREDVSGETIRQMVSSLGETAGYGIVPDEKDLIMEKLIQWSNGKGIDLILTTGGTGLALRDVTPEATLSVIDREVPGLAEAMRSQAMSKSPQAMLSRAVAGTRGRTLIINLPGSPKGVRESLEVLLPVLPHALAILKGETDTHPG